MTSISETPVPAPPTSREIDLLIAEYAAAQTKVAETGAIKAAADKVANEIKGRLIAMVESFGSRHTEKSKRIVGIHNTATTTTGTYVSVDAGAVENFKSYLEGQTMELGNLVDRFFSTHTSYSMVQGPGDVLKTLTMAGRVRKKMESLIGLCFSVSTKTPSLKIDMVTPVQPAKGN